MSQILKSMFSTSAQARAAERIARPYKSMTISFLDKSHQSPEDWQRLMTYANQKKLELEKEKLVEIMARGTFHPPRVEDKPKGKHRLTVWLLNMLGIPIKSVHVNEDGTEDEIWDIPEQEQRALAAKVAASKAAAAASAAGGAGSSGSKGGKKWGMT